MSLRMKQLSDENILDNPGLSQLVRDVILWGLHKEVELSLEISKGYKRVWNGKTFGMWVLIGKILENAWICSKKIIMEEVHMRQKVESCLST